MKQIFQSDIFDGENGVKEVMEEGEEYVVSWYRRYVLGAEEG